MASPTSSGPQASGSKPLHPLRTLNDDEIRAASSILLTHIKNRDYYTGRQTKVHFKNVSLHEPPKALLYPYLQAEADGVPIHQRSYVPRCVDIIWSTDSERKVTESTVSLDSRTVVGETHAKKGQHGPNDR